jgi:hypothetical protein
MLKMWYGLKYIPDLMIHAAEIYTYHLSNKDLGKIKVHWIFCLRKRLKK